MKKSLQKKKGLLFAFIFIIGLLSACAKTPIEDYSFQTLYTGYWGKSEAEFVAVYPIDSDDWEKTEEISRDFLQQKHNCTVYKSINEISFYGFPGGMELAFTENYGMTNLYYVIKQENLSREDYHQTVFALYHDLCDFFGGSDSTKNKFSDDQKYWYDYNDIDEFFDYLNKKADKQQGREISVSWSKVSDEYPVTLVQLTSHILLPYEDSGTMSLELRILRDITEGAQ